MKKFLCAALAGLLGCGLACSSARATTAGGANAASGAERVERGKYLVQISGCNDCHTEGYIQSEGNVAADRWLAGAQLGWRGPWGTTYGANLRLYMSKLTEDQWVQVARKLKSRPPMPWFALHAMQEEDLRAIYQFVRTLQPIGDPAPYYVPPDREPMGPYVQFPSP